MTRSGDNPPRRMDDRRVPERRDGPPRRDNEIRREEPREPRREKNPKDVELPQWNPSNGPVSCDLVTLRTPFSTLSLIIPSF